MCTHSHSPWGNSLQPPTTATIHHSTESGGEERSSDLLKGKWSSPSPFLVTGHPARHDGGPGGSGGPTSRDPRCSGARRSSPGEAKGVRLQTMLGHLVGCPQICCASLLSHPKLIFNLRAKLKQNKQTKKTRTKQNQKTLLL